MASVRAYMVLSALAEKGEPGRVNRPMVSIRPVSDVLGARLAPLAATDRFHLAQVNIALPRAPLDSPEMASSSSFWRPSMRRRREWFEKNARVFTAFRMGTAHRRGSSSP